MKKKYIKPETYLQEIQSNNIMLDISINSKDSDNNADYIKPDKGDWGNIWN